MNRMVTLVLTLIVLVLGAMIVFTNPLDPTAITVGMFFVSVSILNLAIQIYFPASPQEEVELKVVEVPETKQIKKMPVRVQKSLVRHKKTARKRKRR